MGHLEVKALERYKFALTGPARLYHVYLDLGVTQLTYSNVGNLEHKTQLAVTLTNTSIVREYNCPLAFIRSGYFGKHDPGYQALYKYAKTRLDHEEDDGERALLCDIA